MAAPIRAERIGGVLPGSATLRDDLAQVAALLAETREQLHLPPSPTVPDAPAADGLVRTLTIANEIGAGWGININATDGWFFTTDGDALSLGENAIEFAEVTVELDDVPLAIESGYNIESGTGVFFIDANQLGNNVVLPAGAVITIHSPYEP